MSREPEVLLVTSTLEVGGSETKIVKIANALGRSGYPVGVAYLNAPHTLRDRIDPAVPVTHLDRRGKFSFRSLRTLRETAGPGARLLIAVNFYPLLYVVPAVRALRDASGYPKAACLVNTTDFVDGQWIWGPAYAPFLRRCDHLVYGCRYQQALWSRKYRLSASRSRCIYNGVDVRAFSPDADPSRGPSFRRDFDVPQDALVVGAIGRFAPEKDFKLLIEAVRRLNATGRAAWLVLVGEGGERRNLLSAAVKAGLNSRVLFPGILEDVRPALAAMDLFVLPSRAVETFSNAALEAMSMARPVVLSNIGGAAEMIEPGESGFLFEAGDVEGLLAAMTRLYDSPRLRERVGGAARRRVEERFGFDGMMAEYEALLGSLLAGHAVAEPASRSRALRRHEG